ncbi:MAG TPA: serine hydrolase domain-containing protein [Candidatus Binatia bacterium]|nr:serine hydrolase domain-containing protein [Candidatus Binatia bacterium]
MSARAPLRHAAPAPALGSVDDGYEPVAARFAAHLAAGDEIGSAVSVHHRGRRVVDVWGGWADPATRRPWAEDTRIVVFSVTKGFAAMALHLLADRGLLDWDAPVARYWPGFGRNGKADIRVGTLLGHRAGLPYLTTRLTLDDCIDPARADVVVRALEEQVPAWEPGRGQGYHATTFGLYARELFERVAGEPIGPFLRRELFEPIGSDVWLGTPASEDDRAASVFPPTTATRLRHMLAAAIMRPSSAEGRLARAVLQRHSLPRAALLNPDPGPDGVRAYDRVNVRRAALAWASATASADGVARAYLPFASGGTFGDRCYLRPETLAPAYERQGWSDCDAVLQKPLGWSNGFLKDEPHVFSPTRESFGHPGLGGALGWCDPVRQLTIGYVTNRLDWRVRSPRAVGLCQALYACDPVRA